MQEIEHGLVSVLMPAYNAEKYIMEAIESILGQTYFQIELIIVEDCSTDSTFEIINSIDDERVRVFRNDVNKGIAFSTNRCIRESRGEFLALLDDDDVAISRRLEVTVNYLRNHQDIDIVGGGAVEIDEYGNIVGNMTIPRRNPKLLSARFLLKDCMINGTVTMRRTVVEKEGVWYEDGCLGMQDYLFYVMASKKVKMANVSDVLLKYRRHSESETEFRKQNDTINRAEKYKEIQRRSLDLSGYRLEENEYSILFELMAERQKNYYTLDEMKQLKEIFAKLINQAREMDKDYVKELEWQCKNWLGERLPRVDLFG